MFVTESAGAHQRPADHTQVDRHEVRIARAWELLIARRQSAGATRARAFTFFMASVSFPHTLQASTFSLLALSLLGDHSEPSESLRILERDEPPGRELAVRKITAYDVH